MPPVPRGTFALDVTHFLHSQALPWGSPHGHVRPRAWESQAQSSSSQPSRCCLPPLASERSLVGELGGTLGVGVFQVPASLGTGFCRGPWWWMLDSSAGSDPHVEGRCSVLERREAPATCSFFSLEQCCRPPAVHLGGQTALAAGAGATGHGSLALLCGRD